MLDQIIIDSKSRKEWECLIDEWVHNETDRKMLKRRLLDGICFEPLAEEFDCRLTIAKAESKRQRHNYLNTYKII